MNTFDKIWVCYMQSEGKLMTFRLFSDGKKAEDYKQVSLDVIMGFQHAYADYMSTYDPVKKPLLDERMHDLAGLGLIGILPNKKYEFVISGGYTVF